ncbi:hypothetical protein ACI76O_01785 [Capnocytophaga cynodegmi]|uniref:hypothetical protein n=1 Tax=Capnocytophaga cynodegmi TaxID=28189 RepID=UPI0038586CCB
MAQTIVTRNANFPEIYAEAAGDHNHAECIDKCNDKHKDENGNKTKGRGACKFNCWVQTVKEVISDIAEIAGAINSLK